MPLPFHALRRRATRLEERTSRRAIALAWFATLAAQLESAHAADAGPGLGATLQAFAGLGVVLALIVATAFVLKRLQPGRFGAASLLKPVASLVLGSRERVVIVELGDKWLVLGVTAQSITTLHTAERGSVPMPAGTSATGDPATGAAAPGSFHSHLGKWIAKHARP